MPPPSICSLTRTNGLFSRLRLTPKCSSGKGTLRMATLRRHGPTSRGAEVYETDADTAVLAGKIADEIGPAGPFLAGMDGLIVAVGRELDAPVVSADSDLTHEETKRVVDIDEYRS